MSTAAAGNVSNVAADPQYHQQGCNNLRVIPSKAAAALSPARQVRAWIFLSAARV